MIAWCHDPRVKAAVDARRVRLEAEDELVPGIPNPMAGVQAVMAEALERRQPRLWYAGIESGR